MLLPGRPRPVSGEWAGKTESWPVFPTRTARAPHFAENAPERPFSQRLGPRRFGPRAPAYRAPRRIAAGRLQRPRPAARGRRTGSARGSAVGIGGERRPRGAPGAFRALTGTDIGEKNLNVKEKNENIGEKSRACPGAFPPAKRNIAAIFKLTFERGLFRADFVALSLRSGGRHDLWRRFASARTPASISSRVFGVPR